MVPRLHIVSPFAGKVNGVTICAPPSSTWSFIRFRLDHCDGSILSLLTKTILNMPRSQPSALCCLPGAQFTLKNVVGFSTFYIDIRTNCMKMLEVELWIDILERPHAARALLILYRYGSLPHNILTNMLSPGSTIPAKRIKELIRAGLILEKRAPDRINYIILTEMGHHVGKHLDEIERYISPDDVEIETAPVELFVR
jgi:hypothetical protein